MMNAEEASLVLGNIGALFFGVILASVLYGVTVVQTWLYCVSYPSDPWYIKGLVLTSFLTDTAHQFLITAALFIYTVVNFNNLDILNQIVAVNTVELYFNGATALLVKSFFTFRIYTLSNKNIPLTVLNVILIVAEFAVSSGYATIALGAKVWADLAPHKVLSSMIVILAAASDILIAVSLCTILYRTKRSSLRNTRALINRLMLFVLNTGILTSMCAIATLVTLLVLPNTLLYIGLYHIMGRLYINSLLATLNARDQIRHYAFEPNMSLMFPTGFSHNTTTVRSSVLGLRQPGRSMHTDRGIEIKIETMTADDRGLEARRRLEYDAESSQPSPSTATSYKDIVGHETDSAIVFANGPLP